MHSIWMLTELCQETVLIQQSIQHLTLCPKIYSISSRNYQMCTFCWFAICRRFHWSQSQPINLSWPSHWSSSFVFPCLRMPLKIISDTEVMLRRITQRHRYLIHKREDGSQNNGKIFELVTSFKFSMTNLPQPICFFWVPQTQREYVM